MPPNKENNHSKPIPNAERNKGKTKLIERPDMTITSRISSNQISIEALIDGINVINKAITITMV